MTAYTASEADRAADHSLRLLGYYRVENLIEPKDTDVHDVTIVGGGQSGIAIAFALRRAGITNVTVLDAGQDNSNGAWKTRGRMRTLRTPKTISGPELGIPALTFSAWYDGTHGAGAFDSLDRIARVDWAEYLSWFRRQVAVETRFGVSLTDIDPTDGQSLRIHLSDGARSWTERTRKLVLATGVSGTGGPYLPTVLSELPSHRCAHTADDIDFRALQGLSVGILGAASSAFDAAAAALEAGAEDVHMYTRRPQIIISDLDVLPNSLVQDHFHLLTDEERWHQRWRAANRGAGVPSSSVDRVAAAPNFHIHADSGWRSASESGRRVVVDATDETRAFDFLIAGTGYQQDPSSRRELASIAPNIARWADVYTPPSGLESDRNNLAPYLGEGYEFTEREPGTAPWLRNIHVFSPGAGTSFGRPVGDIPSLRTGVPHLTRALARDLVLDFASPHVAPVS